MTEQAGDLAQNKVEYGTEIEDEKTAEERNVELIRDNRDEIRTRTPDRNRTLSTPIRIQTSESTLGRSRTKEVRQGYKHTALGWIPEEWEAGRLVEIFPGKDIVKTGPFGSSLVKSFFVASGFKVYGQDNVIAESFDIGNYYINEEKYEQLKQFQVRTNDILISLVGTLGRVLIVPEIFENGVINPRLLRIRLSQTIVNSNFFAYFLKSDLVQKQLKESSTGGTMDIINAGVVKNITIILPPLPEQQKIAAILSIWDEAINKTQQLIEKLKKRHKGLMQQLLTGKKRLKGFEGEWKELHLSDLFERVTRKNTENNTNVLTISAQKGLINQGSFFNKQVASEILDNYFLLKKGEFAYNKSYSNGYPMGAIKRLNYYNSGVVTTLYICFKIRDSQCASDFFEHYFEAGLLNQKLEKIAHEGGRAHGLLNVTPNDFFNLKITVPDPKEQCAIATLLSTSELEIKKYEQQLANLQQQKKGLMQKLLTGEVRVK